MDDKHSDIGQVDIEAAHSIRAEIKVAVKDHVQETLNTRSSCDSLAGLLTKSMTGGEVDEEAQQPTTTSSEDNLPSRPTWKTLVQLVTIFIPFFTPVGIVFALSTTGTDPLMFSFLAFLLLVLPLSGSFAVIVIVVCDRVLYFVLSSLDFGNMK